MEFHPQINIWTATTISTRISQEIAIQARVMDFRQEIAMRIEPINPTMSILEEVTIQVRISDLHRQIGTWMEITILVRKIVTTTIRASQTVESSGQVVVLTPNLMLTVPAVALLSEGFQTKENQSVREENMVGIREV